MENEPAFPTDSAAQVGPQTWHYEGLTKLEYFAGLAMQGELASYTGNCALHEIGDERLAILAPGWVRCAKALLAALEKEQANGK